MMRSLYAAISGLKNHQIKMDVIGNNIANVNTVGFKSGSVTFQDMLSQTLAGASSGNGTTGGTNPMQVGLGVSTAAISTNFTDGSAQSTGNQTDLAISGQGFFILGDPLNQTYSRAGNFTFDASGNLVVPGTGMKVLGWQGNSSGVVSTTGPISGIQIPVGSSMPAKVSSTLTMKGNLNASAIAIGTLAQRATAAANLVTANTAKATADNISQLAAQAKTDADIAAASAATAKASAAQALIDANAVDAAAIAGTLTAALVTTAQQSALKAKNDAATASANAATAATSATTAFTAGAGSNANALTAKATAATAATAAANAYASINALTAASTAAATTPAAGLVGTAVMSTGQAVTDTGAAATSAGSSASAAATVAATAATNVATAQKAVAAANDKSSDQPGSLNVYDSQGNSYKLNGTFEKTGTNVWSFTPASTVTDGNGNVVANVTAAPISITFDANGVFQASSASTISVNPAGGPYAGAGTFTMTPDFSTMTQYGTDTTAKMDSTDGYTAGTLTAGGGITISKDGTIVGTFTNGKKMDLAKIAMATFNNPGGLMKEGDSLYAASSNSGTPNVGTAGTGGRGTFTPGSLEMSNVDLAQQFSDMIVTQRGFQANSKIITTDDSMLEELVNLKR